MLLFLCQNTPKNFLEFARFKSLIHRLISLTANVQTSQEPKRLFTVGSI